MVIRGKAFASKSVSTDRLTDAGFFQKAPRLSDFEKAIDKYNLELYFRYRATPHASSLSVSA